MSIQNNELDINLQNSNLILCIEPCKIFTHYSNSFKTSRNVQSIASYSNLFSCILLTRNPTTVPLTFPHKKPFSKNVKNRVRQQSGRRSHSSNHGSSDQDLVKGWRGGVTILSVVQWKSFFLWTKMVPSKLGLWQIETTVCRWILSASSCIYKTRSLKLESTSSFFIA